MNTTSYYTQHGVTARAPFALERILSWLLGNYDFLVVAKYIVPLGNTNMCSNPHVLQIY